jgi:hypothetical protein
MSVGCATSVSQPEAPIGVTVPMYSRPASEKTPGFEATSEPGLHQRQVAKVFLARSAVTGIRVRHDLARGDR